MLILDTDHVSILGFPSEGGVALLERIDASGEEVATTIITVEEQLRGWLAEINRLSDMIDCNGVLIFLPAGPCSRGLLALLSFLCGIGGKVCASVPWI